MEHFEIAKTEEEREKDYQKVIDYMRKNGIKEELKLFNILNEKTEQFGLNNNFPKLSERQDERRDGLFQKRNIQIAMYNRLRVEIEPLLVLERNMWYNLNEINKEICEIEGHRLSEEVSTEYDDDGLGCNSVSYYRTCLVCGKRVYKEGLKRDDVVVKGEEGPKRILFK